MVNFQTYVKIEDALNNAWKELNQVRYAILNNGEIDEVIFQKRINKVLEEIEYLREEQIFTLQIEPDE